MKLIFLDIDGVLNNQKMIHEDPEFKRFKINETNWYDESVDALREIVKQTAAKIVISSTWRKIIKDKDAWLEMFRRRNCDFDVIGLTGSARNAFRGREINEFLEDKQVESFLILDDDSDFYPDQPRMLIDAYHGLRMCDVEQAVRILNKEESVTNLRCMEERVYWK